MEDLDTLLERGREISLSRFRLRVIENFDTQVKKLAVTPIVWQAKNAHWTSAEPVIIGKRPPPYSMFRHALYFQAVFINLIKAYILLPQATAKGFVTYVWNYWLYWTSPCRSRCY